MSGEAIMWIVVYAILIPMFIKLELGHGKIMKEVEEVEKLEAKHVKNWRDANE